jgi:hypothetical protein
MAPTAGEEDNARHQSEQEQAEVGEAEELREHEGLSYDKQIIDACSAE